MNTAPQSNNLYLTYSLLTAAFSSALIGLNITSANVLVKVFSKSAQSVIDMSLRQIAVMVSIFYLGPVFYSFIKYKINLKLKQMVLVANLFNIFGWLIILQHFNVYTIYFGRFLLGLSAGAITSIIPIYLARLAPDKYKNCYTSLYQVLLTFGVLLGQIQNYYFNTVDNWYIGCVCLIGLISIHSVLLFFIKSISIKNVSETTFKDFICYVPGYKPLITAILMHMGQQFSCIRGIIQYGNIVFMKTRSPQLMNLFLGLYIFLSAVLASVFLQKISRRTIFNYGLIQMTIGLICLTFNLDFYICVIIYVLGYSLSLGPVPYMILGDLFRKKYQIHAVNTIVGINWLTCFSVSLIFPLLNSLIGTYVYLPFAFFQLCLLAYSYFIFDIGSKELSGLTYI